MTTRQILHSIVDELPESKLYNAKSYLKFLTQDDDEPEEELSEEDIASIRLGREAIQRGEVITHEEMLARFGIEPSSL